MAAAHQRGLSATSWTDFQSTSAADTREMAVSHKKRDSLNMSRDLDNIITKQYCFEILESRHSDDKFARRILDFIVAYPIHKYTKTRKISINTALKEMQQLIQSLYQIRSVAHLSTIQTKDLNSILGLFLQHFSIIMGRIIVEILINIVEMIDPHLRFWRKESSVQSKLYPKWLLNVCSEWNVINWSDAIRKTRVFTKLREDILNQIGHIQSWVWTLASQKSFTKGRQLEQSIIPFITEITQLFNTDNAPVAGRYSEPTPAAIDNNERNSLHNSVTNQIHMPTDGNGDEMTYDNIDDRVSQPHPLIQIQSPFEWIDVYMDTATKTESFVIKLEHNINRWAKPSHLARHWRRYCVGSISGALCCSLYWYYKPTQGSIISRFRHNLNLTYLFFYEHGWEPLYAIYDDVVVNAAKSVHSAQESEDTLQMEQRYLKEMVDTFTIQNAAAMEPPLSDEFVPRNTTNVAKHNELCVDFKPVMYRYTVDIQKPFKNSIRGSLITNMLIQIQKMKVDVSQLMVDVSTLMDANKINLNLMATIPSILCVWALVSLTSSFIATPISIGTRHKKMQIAKSKLRRLLRELHSILLKNLNESYLSDEECGLMMCCIYRLSKWGETQLANSILSAEENDWLQLDCHYFIGEQFSVGQRMNLVRRLETYYLTAKY